MYRSIVPSLFTHHVNRMIVWLVRICFTEWWSSRWSCHTDDAINYVPVASSWQTNDWRLWTLSFCVFINACFGVKNQSIKRSRHYQVPSVSAAKTQTTASVTLWHQRHVRWDGGDTWPDQSNSRVTLDAARLGFFFRFHPWIPLSPRLCSLCSCDEHFDRRRFEVHH